MHTIYIHELEGGNYYVGVTANFDRRSHEYSIGQWPEWVQLHNPLQMIHAIYGIPDDLGKDFEKFVRDEMIVAYGAPNVRGGGACIAALRGDGKNRLRRALKIVSSDRHWLGVEFEWTFPGVIAQRLIPGSPAEIAGMRQGDVLEKVEDRRVNTIDEALIRMSFVQPDSLKLTVRRRDGPHDLHVVRPRRPQ